MPRARSWTDDHVNFLETLVRENRYTTLELATLMARQFHRRVTTSHITTLLRWMRDPTDPFYRNLPYGKPGARFSG